MELKVVFFLVLVFFVGASLYYLKYQSDDLPLQSFDYSEDDSLFVNGGKSEITEENRDKNIEKRVDSEPELLDFRARKLAEADNSKGSLNIKININNASIETLMQLPGIGQKTAEKIIAFRKQNNGFNSISDIMLVKGIGEAKFNRIKEFIIIE